jgi:hypothetical protein
MREANALVKRVSPNPTSQLQFFTCLIPVEEPIRHEACVLLKLERVKWINVMSGLIPAGQIRDKDIDGMDDLEKLIVLT